MPIDPFRISRRIGLDVVEVELKGSTVGALVKKHGRSPRIVVNARDHVNRRRFTCAHELGHYIRYSDDAEEYERITYRNELSSRGTYPEEVYANEFAACLLMPELEVRRLCVEQAFAWEMAELFGVSREAMRFRLDGLGVDG
jgi:Zn-dependent peptidase ImmA (M78 family)